MSDARVTAGGAVAAAFGSAAAWLCCLPFALGVLGTVGAGVAQVLGPIRPWVTALSVGLLGIAFFQAYRVVPARSCAPDRGCARPESRARTRLFLWIAAVGTILLITVPYWLSWAIYLTL